MRIFVAVLAVFLVPALAVAAIPRVTLEEVAERTPIFLLAYIFLALVLAAIFLAYSARHYRKRLRAIQTDVCIRIEQTLEWGTVILLVILGGPPSVNLLSGIGANGVSLELTTGYGWPEASMFIFWALLMAYMLFLVHSMQRPQRFGGR